MFPSKCRRKAILVCLDMLICIYGFLFVYQSQVLADRQSVRQGFPSGKMHLSIYIFNILHYTDSHFPFPFDFFFSSLHCLQTHLTGGMESPGSTFSQTRAKAQASKHCETSSYPTKPGAQSKVPLPSLLPSHEAVAWCARQDLRLCSASCSR